MSYRLPPNMLYLPRERELDAVDAIYFLAHKYHPETFELTPAILSQWTKGHPDHSAVRRSFKQTREWAESEGLLIVQGQTYARTGGGPVYTCLAHNPGPQALHKPTGYIERGWIWTLEGIHVRWLLNFLLHRPADNAKGLQALTQHFGNIINLHEERRGKMPLRIAQINDAFEQLF